VAEGAIAGEAGIRRGWLAWSPHLFGSIKLRETHAGPTQGSRTKKNDASFDLTSIPKALPPCLVGKLQQTAICDTVAAYLGSVFSAASPGAPFSFDAAFPATATGFYVMGGLRTVDSIQTP